MATEHFLNWIERQAAGLRSLCEVQPFGRLDPFELARRMDVKVLVPDEIQGLPEQVAQQLLARDAARWSAGTLPLPDGRHLVVMNPTHDVKRQHASLMEELAHVRLGHKPSQLVSTNGIRLRSFNKTQETEAYWVGAAALLPRRVMKGARTLRLSVEHVAEEHRVSTQLVGFREKVLGVYLCKDEFIHV